MQPVVDSKESTSAERSALLKQARKDLTLTFWAISALSAAAVLCIGTLALLMALVCAYRH